MAVLHGYYYLLLQVLGSVAGYTNVDVVTVRATEDPGDLPCPDEQDIYPCVCYINAHFVMDLECSAVVSEEQLARVFSIHFPFPDFRQLTIYNNTYLQALRAGALGNATFYEFHITRCSAGGAGGGALRQLLHCCYVLLPF